MQRALRYYWILLPVLASMATECGQTPRGVMPTSVTSVELILASVPAQVPTDLESKADYDACLRRMGVQNNVRPSWEGRQMIFFEPSGSDVWSVVLTNVPVGFTNTMTVHDTNECAREPEGDGRVVTGVTANGTVVDLVVGENRTLSFEVSRDGSVTVP